MANTEEMTLYNFGLTEDEYFRFNQFKKYTDQLAKTLFTKNNDYGSAIAETGTQGCDVRIYDKQSRIKNIILNGRNTVEDEPVDDTYWDNAGYSILALMIIDKSPIFYDRYGKLIANKGMIKKQLTWLQKHRKIINKLIVETKEVQKEQKNK